MQPWINALRIAELYTVSLLLVHAFAEVRLQFVRHAGTRNEVQKWATR